MARTEDFLEATIRAQDILLGALGYSEEATIVKIEATSSGYKGIGCWTDGEEFEFESTDSLSEIELWALSILEK